MNLIKCMFINSPWYKETKADSKPIGILWHDTAGGNPNLKRYVQPYETDPNYDELIELLGKNTHGNDWNHSGRRSGVNAFIGKLADGTIATAQVGEWEMCPWGCGSGSKGSLNGYYRDKNKKDTWVGKHFLQFEICDNGYGTPNEAYFKKVYQEACEFTAYICKLYDIDPLGTVNFNGVTVPTIVCHKDSNNLDLGSAHGDIYVWFGEYGVTMDDVRRDVAALVNTKDEPEEDTHLEPEELVYKFQVDDVVRFDSTAIKWANGSTIPSWVKAKDLYVVKLKDNNRVSLSTTKGGSVTGTAYEDDLYLVLSAAMSKVDDPITRPDISVKEPIVITPVEGNDILPVNPDPIVTTPKVDDEPLPDTSAQPDTSEDTPDEDELGAYVKDIGEAQTLLVKLLNLIIDFIVKMFSKKD